MENNLHLVFSVFLTLDVCYTIQDDKFLMCIENSIMYPSKAVNIFGLLLTVFETKAIYFFYF